MSCQIVSCTHSVNLNREQICYNIVFCNNLLQSQGNLLFIRGESGEMLPESELSLTHFPPDDFALVHLLKHVNSFTPEFSESKGTLDRYILLYLH